MTAALARLRSLVSEVIQTVGPRPDQTVTSMSSEGAQKIKSHLTALHQLAQAEHHGLREEIRRLVVTAELQPLQLLQHDLQLLHAASTPCQALNRMRPRIFCQTSCRHTAPWESCPNQIPQWIWSGSGGPTEESIGVTQDASARFLRATRDAAPGTFLTAFGEAAIIHQDSKIGREFEELHSASKTALGGKKCQYTYRESTGSKTYWISPQQDIDIISNKASKALKRALAVRSRLLGSGQAAQHSCCKQPSCRTSINAELGLIMRSSSNDDEDECLGAGLFATRAIRTGEQILVSYSDNITRDWESTFGCRCYCCHCSGTCSTTIPTGQAPGHHMPHDSLAVDMKAPDPEGMVVDGLPAGLTDPTKSSEHSLASDTDLSPEQLISAKRFKGLPKSNKGPSTPKERASSIRYQYYVRDTLRTFQRPIDFHTLIVDSYGIPIKGQDFVTLQANEMICDGIVDWMLQWWTT